jgi:hypothetical protein
MAAAKAVPHHGKDAVALDRVARHAPSCIFVVFKERAANRTWLNENHEFQTGRLPSSAPLNSLRVRDLERSREKSENRASVDNAARAAFAMPGKDVRDHPHGSPEVVRLCWLHKCRLVYKLTCGARLLQMELRRKEEDEHVLAAGLPVSEQALSAARAGFGSYGGQRHALYPRACSLLATSHLDLGAIICLADGERKQVKSVSCQNRIARCKVIEPDPCCP